MSDSRYWIAPTSSVFNSTPNWSLSSGGSGGASIPGSSQLAVFDTNGVGNCQFNIPVSVSGIRLSGYPGTIQVQNSFVIGPEGGTLNSGIFQGGSSRIDASGSIHINGTDFTSTTSNLTLLGNFRCDGTFHHSDGTVRLGGNNNMDSRGTHFGTLVIDSDSTGPRINSSCFVDNVLILNRGILQGSDGTIHVLGDVSCNGGAWSSSHNAIIQMTGGREQRIYTSGGILPTLVIDKTSNHVVLGGVPPLYINGDFLVMNGKMNTAGIDLEVGGGF